MTPDAEATNEVSTGTLDNTGRHQYRASGLTAGDDYEVALVNAEDVTAVRDVFDVARTFDCEEPARGVLEVLQA